MLLQNLTAWTWAWIPKAYAQLNVSGLGFGGATFQGIVGSIVEVLTATIVYVSGAIFVIGAGLFIISAGDEGRKSQGKQMMIGSLIGVGVVVGGKAILNTIMYFLYG
jgi:hypothetical protein